ncbi:MAG: hypothetical protein ACYCYM_06455 [Saccharofermentanales bacterium]
MNECKPEQGAESPDPDMICLSDIADGQTVDIGDSFKASITSSIQQPSLNTQIFEFRFDVSRPQRFSTGFNIPADAANACATLNNMLLTGLFSDYLPESAVLPDYLTRSADSSEKHSHKISSTISPGKMQVINFKWFDQDVLRFYLYFKQ